MKPKKFDGVKVYYYSGKFVDCWFFKNITKRKACDIVKRLVNDLRIVSVIGFNYKIS